MEPQIWNDVAVDCSTVMGAPVAITAISSANPAVASAADHEFVQGDTVLLRLEGYPALDIVVVEVGAVVADTSFVLLGIDGSELPAGVKGTAEKVTFGATANVITEVTGAGGESADVLMQTIHPGRAYNRNGKESPLVYTFGAFWVPTDPVLQEFKRAKRDGKLRAVRFVFADGSRMLMAGAASASLVANGSAGAPVTTPAKLNVRGEVMAYEGV